MPFTVKPSVLAQYFIDFFDTRRNTYGLKDVFYGDQEYIPESPTVCVEPVVLTRELVGVPHRMDNDFGVGVLCYAADPMGNQAAQRDADSLAESIAHDIDIDGLPDSSGGTRFGGLVVHGFVSEYRYGYVVKRNKLMRANRLIVSAMNKTNRIQEA
jgi:hypothetical protein